ncbi:MAG: Cytidylate kinase [Microgenomates group bacterium GW2011_GWC1_37_8]|uniref:Cytidylate kinase n=1 Tax=Candidatus Woesebacteria bacterium GW2011_GWB1_38_8 TaxID=1618570 RepID=A0A0G0NGK9_9BACT|nr:MAG: Cytidylate kinase [Microgenomates group bacterium GW2011_GWC1_37_8]KKQ85044.1 MAG: Cytidylate kinase [Candidatus Woesebacteria bacterium GW2011_GWB1_38_8]
MKLAIAGLTASGKSYHAKRLSKKFNLEYFEASKLLIQSMSIQNSEVDHFWISKQAQQLIYSRNQSHQYDLDTDKALMELAENKDNFIIDSWILPWLYKKKDLIKIYLLASAEAKTEMAYLSTISKLYTKKELSKKIQKKDEKTRQMFLGLYNIDIYNYENFDIVLDISKSYTNPEGVTNLLEKLILDHNSQTSTFSSNFKGF